MLIPKRKSNRLPGYDYTKPGYYFVTISTARYQSLFGTVGNGNRIVLNNLGWITEEIWRRNDVVYPNFRNCSYCLMPDHFHALVQLLYPNGNDMPVPHLSTVIRSFKGCVTKALRSATSNTDLFVWQHGYHENIVNSQVALDRIREYITFNPRKLNEHITARKISKLLASDSKL